MSYQRIEELINTVTYMILQNGGKRSYVDIGKALLDEANLDEFWTACIYLEISTICHNIPFYKNGERYLRKLDECFRDAITFYNTNKAESEIVHNSELGGYTDILTGFTLPKLTFGDDTHSMFKSGTGEVCPDLRDDHRRTYEVKRNYRGGSRSSLHKAEYLIDCLNTTIEIRKIEANNKIDLDHYPLARFNGFLSERIISPKIVLSEELLQLIYSGELIPEIERRLDEKGFKWNP